MSDLTDCLGTLLSFYFWTIKGGLPIVCFWLYIGIDNFLYGYTSVIKMPKGRYKKNLRGVPFLSVLLPSMGPLHFWLHLCTPSLISDDYMVSPHFYFFLQKVCMHFAIFLYYPKRHDVIKFRVLCD